MDSVELLALRRHLAIKDHRPGRLKVTVGYAAAAGTGGATLRRLKEDFEHGRGVRALAFNPLFMTMTIDYDPTIIPSPTWEAFVSGDDQQASAAWDLMTRP
jgi:hypothetical protein